MQLSRQDGEKKCSHEITGSPLSGGGAVIVFRDVTDRLETEAREAELKQALIRAQRQEAVSQLAAGIAHDFNNLLSAINGSATLIKMAPEQPDTVSSHAERIMSAGSQAARLVNRLLDFGAHSPDSSTFELSTALAAFQSLIEPGLPNNIKLVSEITSEPLLMRGDPNDLNQAVMNLVFNARDAIGDNEGVISVKLERFETKAPLAVLSGVLSEAGAFVRITVSDTGAGMSETVMQKALEPYFTTKGRVGTGLGLAVAAMQLSALGGGIDIQSVQGQGTTVTIYWPCHHRNFTVDDEGAPTVGPDLAGSVDPRD